MKLINDLVSRSCGRLGAMLARHPDYFILLPVFLTLFLATYLQHIDYDRDLFRLFTPKNGRAMRDRDHIERLFGPVPNHQMSRSLGLPLVCAVIVRCRDQGSILRTGPFHDVRRVHEGVSNVTGTYHGRTYRYDELCDKDDSGDCYDANTIMELTDERLENINSGNSDVKYPLRIELEELIVEPMGFQMGGVKVTSDDYVISAESIILVYFLNATKFDPIAFEWSKSFVKYLQNFDTDELEISMYTWRATEDGFEDTILIALMFFIGTLVVMVLFTFVTSSSSNGIPWLGILGCLSSVLSVVSAFGFTVVMGFDLIAVAVVVPFLMLGIGMDNTFILLASWRKTDIHDPLEKRMSETMAHAGSSITISSLTSFASFAVGAFVIFPGVQIFCVYIATAMAFTHLYHLTFFGGCLALLGKIRLSFTEGQWLTKAACCMKELGSSTKKVEDHAFMRFFRDTMGPVLADRRGQAAVLVAFLLSIASGLYGLNYYSEGMKIQRLVTYDHYIVKFFDLMDQYYRVYPFRIQVVVEGDLDYGEPEVRARVDAILRKFEASKYISKNTQLTESWLRAYEFALTNPTAQILGISCEKPRNESFAKCIQDLLANIPLASIFANDFVFDKSGDRILASRHVIQPYMINDTVDEKNMVLNLREIADSVHEEDSSINVIVYNGWFLFFDQFVYMKSMAVMSLSSAIGIVMLVSFLFIPQFMCMVWIGLSSISIFITVLGFLSYWGVSMDMVGLVGLIMCIGFSVDYAFHISFAYVSSTESSPELRLKSALYSMGMPIVQSSVSTMIGIVILCFIPSYCFSAFTRTVFLVIGMGTLHGLFFLPVFFTLFDTLVTRRQDSRVTKPLPEPVMVFSMNKLQEG